LTVAMMAAAARMKIISFITEPEVIRKILEHLGVEGEKATVEHAPPGSLVGGCASGSARRIQNEKPFIAVH
jgi:hypothetical protein